MLQYSKDYTTITPPEKLMTDKQEKAQATAFDTVLAKFALDNYYLLGYQKNQVNEFLEQLKAHFEGHDTSKFIIEDKKILEAILASHVHELISERMETMKQNQRLLVRTYKTKELNYTKVMEFFKFLKA